MASQAVRQIRIHLSGQPVKIILFETVHHHFNLSRHFSCIKNRGFLSTSPLMMVLGSSSEAFYKTICLTQLSCFKTQQGEHNYIFPHKKQLFTRWMSTKTDKEYSFDSKDKCSIFDESGMFVKETTFNQAKLLASNQNSRLVYLRKNPDGVACFSLQQLPGKAPSTKSSSEHSPVDSKGNKKDHKASAKEYKIKASIADHDLNIKLGQIKSHLSKDRQVVIFIKESSLGSQVSQKGGSELMKRLKEELGELCKVNQDYSNATTTRLTLTPKENHILQSNQKIKNDDK